MNKVLILGITGQDGSYMSKKFIDNKYEVYGASRYINYKKKNLIKLNIHLNIKKIYKLNYNSKNEIFSLVKKIEPDIIVNFSGESSVSNSFNNKVETYKSIIDTTELILDCIKNYKKKIIYLNAASSECFGIVRNGYASLETKFNPLSPYAKAKTISIEICRYYRSTIDVNAINAILFNHESILRGESTFLFKLINGIDQIKKNKKSKIIMGNLDQIRDFGWAPDYINGMFKSIFAQNPDDYIFSTMKGSSLKTFATKLLFQSSQH